MLNPKVIHQIVAGSELPSLEVQVTNDLGVALDLTTATAVSVLAQRGGATPLALTTAISNATSGIINVTFDENPIAIPGDYRVIIKIDFGTIESYLPSTGAQIIRVHENPGV